METKFNTPQTYTRFEDVDLDASLLGAVFVDAMVVYVELVMGSPAIILERLVNSSNCAGYELRMKVQAA